MHTTLYLIRHGEAYNPEQIIYGRAPVPLTDKGRQQIKDLAERFKKEQVIPDIIIASPIRRTVETAEEIKKVFPQTPLHFEKNLQEHGGDLSSMTIKHLLSLGDYYMAQECIEMGLERPESIVNRMYTVMQKVIKTYPGKTIFIVSHGDPLAWLIWKLLHPTDPIPSILDIQDTYPQQGQARQVLFDENGKLLQTHPFCSA